MARLGPFGPAPRLAVGASGGADSTALALLAQNWAAAQGGSLIALIVDHGLREASAAEAALTQSRLAARGIETRVLTLSGLPTAGLQEAARTARHAALAAAAAQAGALFLLLGHHAADQAETVAMRAARGTSGLEGMAGWTARDDVLMLRPLLAMQPAALRAFLQNANMPWLEDPSNQNAKFERVRIRQAGAGRPPAPAAPRQQAEQETATFLARHATLRPEGYAIIRANKLPQHALAALLRTIAGATYAPDVASVAALAAELRPATIGGVIIKPTRNGWLLTREPAACAPPVPATEGATWDNRFRIRQTTPNATIGALGPDTPKFRHTTSLPAIILQSQPCLRHQGTITYPTKTSLHPLSPTSPHAFAP
jgi:tRNA(Ile)-lysidine synthase